jgi:hypothetical protein
MADYLLSDKDESRSRQHSLRRLIGLMLAVVVMGACGSSGPPAAEPAAYAQDMCDASHLFVNSLHTFSRGGDSLGPDAFEPANLQQTLVNLRDMYATALTAANQYSTTVNDHELPKGDEFPALRAALSHSVDNIRGPLNQGRANFDVKLEDLNVADAAQIDANLDETFTGLEAGVMQLRDTIHDAIGGPLKGGNCEGVVLSLDSL